MSKAYVHSLSDTPGHSSTYRNIVLQPNQELYTTLRDGSTTLYHSLQNSIKKHGTKICFGSRKIVKVIEETKVIEKADADGNIVKEEKAWKFPMLSGFEWVSFDKLSNQLTDIGAGLVKLGLGKGKMLAMYAPTR